MASSVNQSKLSIAVIGLGYVGLPLALSFSEAGIATVGIDVDDEKIKLLANGESYLQHLGHHRVQYAIGSSLSVTSDPAGVSHCNAVLICVPTPLDEHLQPDLRYVEKTCQSIAPHLSANTLVVLESTTWPGTTEEVVKPTLEKFGPRRFGQDLLIAFSPEREDPGNKQFKTTDIPKIIGGLDQESQKLAESIYNKIFNSIVPVSDPKVAEAAKLCENIFRSVNIALVNELKVIFDRMEIDVWQVIDAAATKPFGYMPFYPGPGLGGHCIPIDPFYLSWKAKEYGLNARFIELAGEINRSMPLYVIAKLRAALEEFGKPVRRSRILILGLAYKANVDDLRESPSLSLLKLLAEQGAEVAYCDPHIPTIPTTRHFAGLAGMTSSDPTADYDAFILATNHEVFDKQALMSYQVPIVDTRRAFDDHPLVFRA